MYRSALGYGEENAGRLVTYHTRNGGIGRDVKFRWFLREVIGTNECLDERVAELKREYSKNLWSGLLTCEEAPGIREILFGLRKEGVSLFVVSGADQDELREILNKRHLAQMFDGIYGAPDTKDEILARQIKAGAINKPSIFLGDSRYDNDASRRAGFDFVFIYGWTDLADWQSFVAESKIVAVKSIADVFEGMSRNMEITTRLRCPLI